MILIKEIGIRQERTRSYMWGLFECPKCAKQIERRKSQGLHQEQCQECFRIYHRNTQIKHGDRYTRLYRIWINMRARIKNSNSHNYNVYGGRGITICDEWDKYETFKQWSLLSGYEETLTIDRINVNGNYTPDNCQWLSKSENSKKDTIVVNIEKYKDMVFTRELNKLKIEELCRHFNVSQTAYYNARKRYENSNNI